MEYIQKIFNTFNINTYLLLNILIAILIFLFLYILKYKFSFLILKVLNKKIKDKKAIKRNAFYKPLAFFFPILGLYIAVFIIGFKPDILAYMTKIFKCLVILLATMGIANSITPKSQIFLKFQSNSKDNTIASLVIKIVRVILYALAFVLIFSELGYNINGLIAGLGLGGLTVALAAQDAAKNLFGGLIIITDKPFSVGDWIETPTVEGTVEDITFRSTRIRTLKDSIITIPNSTLANEAIINWNKLTKRRISLTFTIDFKTNLKDINKLNNDIITMLQTHSNVIEDSASVHFDEIKDNGYKINVFFYSSSTGYDDYLDIKENINYKIIQIIENDNIKMAYLNHSVYLQK